MRRLTLRRGSAALTFALMLVTIFGLGSLGIDRNLLQVRDVEAQNAANAVAHAAVTRLDGTAAGLDRARESARKLGLLNYVGTSPVALGVGGVPATATLQLGRWLNGRFVVDDDDPADVNAVRVVVVRVGIPGVFAGPAFAIEERSVAGESIAVAGGVSYVPCPLPLAVPSCELPHGERICDADLVLGADANDTAGWANLGSSRPSASSIRGAIEDCDLDGVDTTDMVTINDGAIASAVNALADAVSGSTVVRDTPRWGAMPEQSKKSGVNPYGRVLEGHLIVLDDPNDCNGTRFGGASVPVVGFVSGIVYDVDTRGGVDEREIRVRLTCEVERYGLGGGGYFGTTAPPHFVEEAD